jgi:cystathionine beta-lyase/cystathionine gamma-synthase
MRRAGFPGSVSRPVVSPLQPSVVYASDDPDALDDQYEGRSSGWTYSREGHPNAAVVAALIDQMEGAEGGVVTGSGMSAVLIALLGVARAGEHVLGADQLYGRSLRMMNEELPRLGIETSLADPTDAGAFGAALRENTRIVLIETVSNPTLRIADVEGIARLCRERGILLALDNTFTTPRAVRALDCGADIVIHSVTKLLSGHSDAMLGYVGTRNTELAQRFALLSATFGTTPSPFDCWLAERGLYSFALRYDRAETTAASLADALATAPGVRRVVYPGRADHPDHNRATALLGGRGGNMVSFEIEGGRAAANAFVRAADGIAFAPTLGDIGTTLSHPPSSSHRALTPSARMSLGISEGFFRVSVGCEEADDLIGRFLRAAKTAAELKST